MSRSCPSFPPQPDVYPRASSDSTLERLPSRTNLTGPMPKLDLNSRPFSHLQPLCRREKSQPLWNQANPASFPKTPGVGWVPRSCLGTLGGSRRRLSVSKMLVRDTRGGVPNARCASLNLGGPSRHSACPCVLHRQSGVWGPRFARHSSLATRHFPLSIFRINTCKSVSKQTTLTPFIINTYEKPGRGRAMKAARHEKQCRE
jgi:hypothetical protein